jgi:hypothetical protein
MGTKENCLHKIPALTRKCSERVRNSLPYTSAYTGEKRHSLPPTVAGRPVPHHLTCVGICQIVRTPVHIYGGEGWAHTSVNYGRAACASADGGAGKLRAGVYGGVQDSRISTAEHTQCCLGYMATARWHWRSQNDMHWRGWAWTTSTQQRSLKCTILGLHWYSCWCG